MEIIPVIDLMHGQVVHAKIGQRQHYQPIQSQLCDSSEPVEIISALLELYPFERVYIADIDAIQASGSHFELIVSLAEQFPQLNFWLDCGIRQMNHRALHYQQNIRPVIGSENMGNLFNYRAVSYGCSSRHVLSLDFNQTNSLGALELHDTAKYWPVDTICMSLNHVGSGLGADLFKLEQMATLNALRKTPSRLYAAGGIRHIDDCYQLKKLDISGVLVASALHNKTITFAEIAELHAQ